LTPLHVAGTHGLLSFTRRLSALPAAVTAASLLDFDGQTASHLARRHGNTATADVIDRLTNQHTASASTGECDTVLHNKRADNAVFSLFCIYIVHCVRFS